MRNLKVYIEINGEQILAGIIREAQSGTAEFSYSEEYIAENFPAISISLPVSKKSFTAEETRNFFEGLLPEGFARKTVSRWIHAAEDDYLTVLQTLGAECLGAIRISDTDEEPVGRYELLSMDEVKSLAREGVSKSAELVAEAHLSLTGASGKVGLYYDRKSGEWYKPIGIAPSTHIVKQSHVRLSGIVINEQICLGAAARLGIEIPESYIINTGNAADSDILFATKRYDRQTVPEANCPGAKAPLRLHQEDFAQALGIPAAAKYESGEQNYLKQVFSLLRNYAVNPMEDQLKLLDILIYDFLVGNTDNHIKNISLLYSSDLRQIRLAPAYDMICTAMYPGCSRNMAIGIGGERQIDFIRKKHFLDAARDMGIGKKIVEAHFERLASGFETAIKESCAALAAQGYEEALPLGERILKTGGFGTL